MREVMDLGSRRLCPFFGVVAVVIVVISVDVVVVVFSVDIVVIVVIVVVVIGVVVVTVLVNSLDDKWDGYQSM